MHLCKRPKSCSENGQTGAPKERQIIVQWSVRRTLRFTIFEQTG